MAMQVIVHVINEEAFVAEMDELPGAGMNYIVVTNPRTRENKHLQWAQNGALRFMFPLTRIAFIEVMMSDQDREGIEPFYRDRAR